MKSKKKKAALKRKKEESKKKKVRLNISLNRFLVLCFTILIIFFVAVATAWLLKIPCIHEFFHDMLSFTGNDETKSTYVEFWGTMVGTIIAIFGALFTEQHLRKSDDDAEDVKIALIIYYDLKYAVRDLKNILEDTKKQGRNKDKDASRGMEQKLREVFVDKSRKLYFDKDWIEHVAIYSRVVGTKRISDIYDFYGALMDINRGVELSKNIGEFVDLDTAQETKKVKSLLKELMTKAELKSDDDK